MKRIAFGLAAAVALSTAAAPTSTAQDMRITADGLTTTVTLITGDQVLVHDGQVQPRGGKGRERMSFRTYKDIRGHLHVVPSDAEPQLTAGTLDRRLFDVSLLAESGYDDRSRDTIPLIVEGGASAQNARQLTSIGAHAIKAPKNGEFWNGVKSASPTKVWLDGKVTANLDRSAAQIGAPQAWQQGLTGGGVTVAVLDTGIDATHPDLADAVVDQQNFTDSPTADDMDGHGTHVASTITGSGKYQGVAPDAKIINGKVLDDRGGGTESGVIAGMEWAATRAKIVNMSLGDSTPSAGDDPMSLALNRLSTQTGALFVVAAGNSGSTPSTPAAADAALTVGAVDREDNLARFSSRGPRLKDNAIKPDITAPGVDIVAAKAKNGSMGTPVGDSHTTASGTSMSTPHVAGAAAILAAQHPTWTGQDIKAALMNTAKPNPGSTVYEQGSGRVDVAKAVSTQVTASPGSLSMGRALWPHDDDEPITRTLTYRNTGSTPQTIDLSIAEQKPAGQGLFSVSPAKLTIPAGGTANATVTADTRVNVPDVMYSAVVQASSGVRVPINVEKAAEEYEVKVKFIDHEGKPATAAALEWRGVDIQEEVFPVGDGSGTIVTRLKKGTYVLNAAISEGPAAMSMAIEPRFVVDQPREFVIDGRRANQPDIAIERTDAGDGRSEFSYSMPTTWGEIRGGVSFMGGGWRGLRVLPSTTTAPEFVLKAETTKARKDGNGGFRDSPYLYRVRMTEKGGVPENVQWSVRDADLARVDSVSRARVPGGLGQRDYTVTGLLPMRLKEFYTPGVPWTGILHELEPSAPFPLGYAQMIEPRTFRLGQKVTEHWNTAVFGPSFPAARAAQRLGDQVSFHIPAFSDAATNAGERSGANDKTVFSRGDVVISEFSRAGFGRGTVPAAKDTYRLHVEGNHDTVTSKLTADWTFTSEYVPGTEAKAIPLLAVRFAPKLDDHNRAKAGEPLIIPVTVQRNGSTKNVTDVKTPEVQVSYDDGATWKTAKLVRAGDRWLMTVLHPKGAKSVSLKAKTGDEVGSFEQTIIRAYDLK